MLRWGLRPFFRPLFHTSLLTLFWCFQAPLGTPKWRQNNEKSLLEGHLCASFVFSMHFSRFLSILHAFGHWKIGVFVEGIANLGFLRFLIFPLVVLSETSFWTHFGYIFGSKIVKNRSRTGFGKMMNFWLLFFHDFGDFWVPWGVPGVPSGAPFSRHFRVFWGLGGKFAAATPFLAQFLYFLMILGVLGCVFWWFLHLFLWILWCFFGTRLTLIRATEGKLIDR